jgi:hypothetical protein
MILAGQSVSVDPTSGEDLKQRIVRFMGGASTEVTPQRRG